MGIYCLLKVTFWVPDNPDKFIYLLNFPKKYEIQIIFTVYHREFQGKNTIRWELYN